MSSKRFWWSVAAVWVVMFVSDWVLHGMWMQPWYQETAALWRTPEDIEKMMPWMWAGQGIFAWAFVWIYSKGIGKSNQWAQALRYAFAVLLLAKVPGELVMWATAPYPSGLVIRWFAIATIQAVAASLIVTWTYKPMKAWGQAKAKSR